MIEHWPEQVTVIIFVQVTLERQYPHFQFTDQYMLIKLASGEVSYQSTFTDATLALYYL